MNVLFLSRDTQWSLTEWGWPTTCSSTMGSTERWKCIGHTKRLRYEPYFLDPSLFFKWFDCTRIMKYSWVFQLTGFLTWSINLAILKHPNNFLCYLKLIQPNKSSSKDEMTKFHSDDYIKFLRSIRPDNMGEYSKLLQRWTFWFYPTFFPLFNKTSPSFTTCH